MVKPSPKTWATSEGFLFRRASRVAARRHVVRGQAGPLGWEVPACIVTKLAEPEKEVVGVVGDYSFQYLIEELAVAAQYKLRVDTLNRKPANPGEWLAPGG